MRPPRRAFRTKREVAYHAIRRAIETGRIAPGQRLVINRIARDLDLSDVPVREALVQLEAEGVLENTPHVGATVTALQPADVQEVYDVSGVLEGAAAGLATPVLTETDWLDLDELLGDMDKAVAGDDLDAFARADVAFHRRLCACCPSTRLVTLIEQLWKTKERLRTAFPVRSRGAPTQREHKAIAAALKAGDAVAAERLMRGHLTESGRNRSRELSAAVDGAVVRGA